MSSDSVISAVSATSQQSYMSAADVERKKKKNKNWVWNDILVDSLQFSATSDPVQGQEVAAVVELSILAYLST